MYSESLRRQDNNTKYESTSNISNSTGDICRICHCEADLDNPLLSPCYCAGSLKYVHQSCLRQWLAASDTRSCELCKFNFILQTKIKPLSEWRTLEMSSVERRRLLCAILFHFVAAVCVIWSLFVLIDRAAEEVQKGLIAWPFWTKLVVVAVGFTGGAVFMYIQCRQYLHLFARWKAHNRIILVQNAPEKPLLTPPSPTFIFTKSSHPHHVHHHHHGQYSPQVIAHCGGGVGDDFHRMSSTNNSDLSNNDSQQQQQQHQQQQMCYIFEKESQEDALDGSSSLTQHSGGGSTSSSQPNNNTKDDLKLEDLCDDDVEEFSKNSRSFTITMPSLSDHQFRSNIREILALDGVPQQQQHGSTSSRSAAAVDPTNKKYSLSRSSKTDIVVRPNDNFNSNSNNRSCVFKSLPNLNTSSENLLV